jgi:DNA-binding response OmpR family regulator
LQEATSDLEAGSNMATVLIIDQDAHIRRLIRQVLERAGFEVTEAETAEDVVALFALRTPDVILLDCLLGGPGWGWTCCARFAPRLVRATCPWW